ncbi:MULTISPECIES: hypothetical protein [unclassified Streptomyces]|nr:MULTISPECIES: hypothetical protein [unclassified Streptomyces]
MDGYDRTAPLEWWADPSTCPGSLRVTLAVPICSGGRKVVILPDSPAS